jgi:hypothetical protein
MLQGFRDLEKVTLAGLPFRAMEVPFTSAASLENLPAAGVDALFLCSGLETSLSAITSYSRRAKLLTLSSTPGYVEGGVSLGAVMEGGKPRLLVNLAASKLEGAQFSSDMMKLAKVIR